MNNLDNFQSQLQNLQRQYQQMLSQQPLPPLQPQVPQISQVPVPQQVRQVQYVEGLAGAKLYQSNMDSNSSEVIMDKDQDIFYIVSKDANGTPATKIILGHFTLEQVALDQKPDILTRKDLEDFKDEIKQLLAARDIRQEAKTE